MKVEITGRQFLYNAYIEWSNDYLSVEKFAEHNRLTTEQGEELLLLARKVFYSKDPDA